MVTVGLGAEETVRCFHRGRTGSSMSTLPESTVPSEPLGVADGLRTLGFAHRSPERGTGLMARLNTELLLDGSRSWS